MNAVAIVLAIGVAAGCVAIVSSRPRIINHRVVVLHQSHMPASAPGADTGGAVRLAPATIIKDGSQTDWTPAIVAAAGPPVCQFAIAYTGSRVIDIFDASGAIRATIDGGGREPAILRSLGAMALASDGSLAIADFAAEALIRISGTSWTRADTIRYNRAPHRSPASVAVLRSGDFAVAGWNDVSPFVSLQPLVFRGTIDGRVLGEWGKTRAYPGGEFTAVMNSAIIAAAGDSILVAVTATGVVQLFDATGNNGEPVKTIRLPPLVALPPPQYDAPAGGTDNVAAERVGLLAARQISAITVDPDGRWFVVQEMTSPYSLTATGSIQVSRERRSLTAVVDPATMAVRYLRLGRAVASIAAMGQYLVAIVDTAVSAAEPVLQIALFTNPFMADARRSKTC